jgi:hypothetical protein
VNVCTPPCLTRALALAYHIESTTLWIGIFGIRIHGGGSQSFQVLRVSCFLKTVKLPHNSDITFRNSHKTSAEHRRGGANALDRKCNPATLNPSDAPVRGLQYTDAVCRRRSLGSNSDCCRSQRTVRKTFGARKLRYLRTLTLLSDLEPCNPKFNMEGDHCCRGRTLCRSHNRAHLRRASATVKPKLPNTWAFHFPHSAA